MRIVISERFLVKQPLVAAVIPQLVYLFFGSCKNMDGFIPARRGYGSFGGKPYGDVCGIQGEGWGWEVLCLP
jgi:hypothetical protein